MTIKTMTYSNINIYNCDFLSDVSIYTIIEDGKVWYHAKSLALKLGYVNTEQAIREHVHILQFKKTYKDLVPNSSELKQLVPSRNNFRHNSVFISEPGIYMLLGGSHKPEAQKYILWLYSELIPAANRAMTGQGAHIAGKVGDKTLVTILMENERLPELEEQLGQTLKRACSPAVYEDSTESLRFYIVSNLQYEVEAKGEDHTVLYVCRNQERRKAKTEKGLKEERHLQIGDQPVLQLKSNNSVHNQAWLKRLTFQDKMSPWRKNQYIYLYGVHQPYRCYNIIVVRTTHLAAFLQMATDIARRDYIPGIFEPKTENYTPTASGELVIEIKK